MQSIQKRFSEVFTHSGTWYGLGLLAIYIALRTLAWKNTTLLEDTDSTSYLWYIAFLMEWPSFGQIVNLDPDFSPFYPFLATLFSLPGWSPEFSARLCSFVFSIGLFFAIAGIGNRLTARPSEIAIGLLLLCFTPILISLSISVLTEPSYIATVYIGLWLFLTQYKLPTLDKAALLGLVFGLSFLNRLEGLIFLAVIPFFQLLHYYIDKKRNYNLKHLVVWTLMFSTCFIVIITPQIWRVSEKMGHFALNGRQVYSVIMNNPDGKSLSEKIFGLDYSDSETNIEYLRVHYEPVKQMAANIPLTTYPIQFLKHLSGFYRVESAQLLGPLVIVFFAFGLLALYLSGRIYESLMAITFIGTTLLPSLLTPYLERHVAIILPLIALIAGIGIAYVARTLLENTRFRQRGVTLLSLLFVAATIVLLAPPLGKAVITPPKFNDEYSHAELQKPLELVRNIATNELHRKAVIVGERGYLAHYSGAKQLYLPYTDLQRLIKFCELNKADFLYFSHQRVQTHPFFVDYLQNGLPKNFALLYFGLDYQGSKVVLYRVLSKP